MCDVAHDAIFRIGVYCDWGYSPMSLCQDAHHRLVDFGNGLVSSGPANVGTLCWQPDANSSQTWPLPFGNGMFREPVPLEDRLWDQHQNARCTVQPSSSSTHQEASIMKRILSIA